MSKNSTKEDYCGKGNSNELTTRAGFSMTAPCVNDYTFLQKCDDTFKTFCNQSFFSRKVYMLA